MLHVVGIDQFVLCVTSLQRMICFRCTALGCAVERSPCRGRASHASGL